MIERLLIEAYTALAVVLMAVWKMRIGDME